MQLKILGLEGSKNIDLITAATEKMSVEDATAALAKTGLTKAQALKILADRGLKDAELETAAATLTESAANVTATTTTGFLTTATASLEVALKGLWATLRANPFILIAIAISGLVVGINTLAQAEEKAAEEAKKMPMNLLRRQKLKKTKLINYPNSLISINNLPKAKLAENKQRIILISFCL